MYKLEFAIYSKTKRRTMHNSSYHKCFSSSCDSPYHVTCVNTKSLNLQIRKYEMFDYLYYASKLLKASQTHTCSYTHTHSHLGYSLNTFVFYSTLNCDKAEILIQMGLLRKRSVSQAFSTLSYSLEFHDTNFRGSANKTTYRTQCLKF